MNGPVVQVTILVDGGIEVDNLLGNGDNLALRSGEDGPCIFGTRGNGAQGEIDFFEPFSRSLPMLLQALRSAQEVVANVEQVYPQLVVNFKQCRYDDGQLMNVVCLVMTVGR